MKHLKTLLGMAVTALGLAAAPASAATVVVNTTTDQSLGSCSSSCSLRDAVATANPGDTVQIPAGHYVLTLGDIISAKNLTIIGAGARSTVLDGNHASRLFVFFNPAVLQQVELTDLSLINGLAATPDPTFGALAGGAVAGASAFTSLSDRLELTLRRCRIAGNQAEIGGAFSLGGGLLILDQSTISGNLATSEIPSFGGGGGIFALASGVGLINSTLTGNTSLVGPGGGAALPGTALFLANSTVTANQAPSGGGLFGPGFGATNTIIAGNTGGDCLAFLASGATDHSMDSDNSCLLSGPGDLSGVTPLLGPLANNGGPTDTHALLAGSPALDAGAGCPATDQRGVARPQGPACDIGAFEVFVPPTPQSQVTALIAQINALVTGGTLAQNKANPLITKLENVLDKLDKEQTNAACGQLGAFINQVNAYIGNGTLTAAQGQALVSATNTLRAGLGC